MKDEMFDGNGEMKPQLHTIFQNIWAVLFFIVFLFSIGVLSLFLVVILEA